MLAGPADSYRPDGLLPEFGLTRATASDVQAQAIRTAAAKRLTGLEQDKIVGEYREVLDLIPICSRFSRVLNGLPRSSPELTAIRDQFGDPRVPSEIVRNRRTNIEDPSPGRHGGDLSHTGLLQAPAGR